jgi:xanthine dehydrogenase YagR molybdenum-binding subunit
MAEETVKPWSETKIIGKPIPPVDGYERVSGAAVYPLDVILPNMLYGAILRCPHAHATVKKIDLGKAREMPGVRAVLTDADPEARVGWYAAAGFPMPGSPMVSRLFDPHCRYEGEEVAAVAAESPQQAWDAVRAIQVEYDTQPFVIDMEEALKPGAPPVQEGGNRARGFPGAKRGDVEKGFAEADVVLEETYRTSCLIHVPMEVHGSVAQWDGDHLTVWDTNQGPFGIQSDISRALKMPLSKVRVISNYMGGGFGSKQEAGKYTVIAALLAQKTARPVKLFLTREETFLCVGNRPAHIMKLKAGVKKDGTLTALQLTAMGELGAYPTFSMVGGQVGELYKCPNVLIDETTAYTNAGQQRAFRAPGYPQGNWALEQMMDALAEKIGMDPVELRLKNIPTVCQTNQDRPYTSTGLRECLTEGARVFGWKEARSRPKGDGAWVRGVGVASGLWGPGSGPATVIVKLNPDGSVNLNMGAADLGTGTKTVAASIVAEELGVPLDRIRIENADTGTTSYSGVSGGSKTVAADGPPTRLAALEVKRFLLEMAAEQLKVPVSDLVFQDGAIMAQGGAKKLAITDLTQLRQQQGIVGVGRGRFVPGDKVVRSFATHFAEVEVNTRTGEMRVLRMLAAHDSGRVMNLLGYRNQIFGGFLQGLGLAMTERRVMDSDTGKMVNANFHDYKIPTAKDAPVEMTCLPIDPHDTECNILGAKGLGEPATVPAATAIANALYHAAGVRVKAAPITAAQVLTLLAEPKTRG